MVGAVLVEIIGALDDEIAAARTDPSRAFDVGNGHHLSGRDEQHLYAFRGDVVLPIQPETPLRVELPSGEEFAGLLVAQRDFEIVLELRENVGDWIERARVSSEPWFILASLRDRLTTALGRAAENLELAMALLGGAEVEPGADPAAGDGAPVWGRPPNPSQRAAIERCAGSRLHFVWGPPGTGKTLTLARVVRALVERGERVLVLGHANAAVDVAMVHVADALAGRPELAAGRVLRIGQPQLVELLARPDVLPEKLLARKQAGAVVRRGELDTQRRELARRLQATRGSADRERLAHELDAVRGALAGIGETLRHAVEVLVRDACVVGATLSRMAIDDTIWRWPADTIVIDETSMATFPFVLAAALRANRRLLLFGDFRQLPPIALATTERARRWLVRDAFEVAGVRQRVDEGEPDARLSLLDTQYRMAAPIADVVSEFAYGGRLTSAGVGGAEALADLGPWPGAAVVLVDTSGVGAACVREARPGGWSRANPVHAMLALGLATRAVREGCGSLALVTPYRAQARLLAAGSAALAATIPLTAATVHRLQGSEHDVVIFDLVDGPPQRGASQLTGADPLSAFRLLNVALSRARGKLLVLADVAFVEARHAAWSPARTLLRLLGTHGRVEHLDPARVSKEAGGGGMAWYDGFDAAVMDLARDLDRARREVIVNVPEASAALGEALAALGRPASLGARVRAGVPKALAGAFADARVEVRDAEPGGLFAFVDAQVAWVGGLGPGGAVVRVEDPRVAVALQRILIPPR